MGEDACGHTGVVLRGADVVFAFTDPLRRRRVSHMNIERDVMGINGDIMPRVAYPGGQCNYVHISYHGGSNVS
jgi:hypothetical protein